MLLKGLALLAGGPETSPVFCRLLWASGVSHQNSGSCALEQERPCCPTGVKPVVGDVLAITRADEFQVLVLLGVRLGHWGQGRCRPPLARSAGRKVDRGEAACASALCPGKQAGRNSVLQPESFVVRALVPRQHNGPARYV